jgi:hypothetical protein
MRYFINRGIAEIEHPSCGGIVRDIEVTSLDERREGTQVSWTDNWRCGAGNPLYWENHEVRFCKPEDQWQMTQGMLSWRMRHTDQRLTHLAVTRHVWSGGRHHGGE